MSAAMAERHLKRRYPELQISVRLLIQPFTINYPSESMTLANLIKKTMLAAGLVVAMSGCRSASEYADQHSSMPISSGRAAGTSTSYADANTTGAQTRQNGLHFSGSQGYMPSEDEDFSAGMSSNDRHRYGGHRTD